MDFQKSKISIIIPAYNAGNFITNTIDSFYASIRNDFEVIIVDDKSTDNTIDVVNTYALQKNNIKLIALDKNNGPGLARNEGLKHATGEYTLFFDSDDLMRKGTVDHVTDFMDKNAIDVAVAKYNIKFGAEKNDIEMWDNDRVIYEYIYENFGNIFNPKLYPHFLTVINYPWTKICRTSYLRKHGVSFGSLRLHEDILPHWMMLMNTDKVYLSDEIICDYNLDPEGQNVTNNKGHMRMQCIDAAQSLHSLILSRPNYRIFLPEFWYFSADVISWAKDIIEIKYKNEITDLANNLFSKISFEDLQHIYHVDKYAHTKICNFIIEKVGV